MGKGAKVGAHANRLPPLWVTQIQKKIHKNKKTKIHKLYKKIREEGQGSWQ